MLTALLTIMELLGFGSDINNVADKCGSDWNASHSVNLWGISSWAGAVKDVCFGGGGVGGEGRMAIPGMLRVKVHRSDYRKETARKKRREEIGIKPPPGF